MSGGEEAASTEEFPVGPLLERSSLDSGGPIEVGVSMTGTSGIDENELEVFLVRSSIDPGERIELGIFVSGVGDVDETDLSVFYDDESVLDLDDPGLVRRNEGATTDESGGTPDGARTPAGDVSGEAPTEYVQSARFRDDPSAAEAGLERVPLEGSRQSDPAYIVELNTRRSAPSGAYSLPVVFTYRSETGIKQVTEIPTLRIRGWRARWRPWLSRLTVALALLGGLVALAWTSSALL